MTWKPNFNFEIISDTDNERKKRFSISFIFKTITNSVIAAKLAKGTCVHIHSHILILTWHVNIVKHNNTHRLHSFSHDSCDFNSSLIYMGNSVAYIIIWNC